VKRASADEQVFDASRLESIDVGARHVGREADEPPEQQADMPGFAPEP
jgi:hypothetical protein